MQRITCIFLTMLLSIMATGDIHSQDRDDSWTYNAVNDYNIEPNIIYSSADGFDCKLDVYARKKTGGLSPTVILIHGGGWFVGSKEEAIGELLPYLEMGLSVVNVNYRISGVALAPAAVEDCRMALRWVIKNAKEYAFDTSRIIVTGGSTGGHLALTTGMLDSSYGLDMPKDPKYANIRPRVAAIINWYGPVDLNDLVSGPNKKDYAAYWLGAQCNKGFESGVEIITKRMSLKYVPKVTRSQSEIDTIATAVSPLSYVRKDLPPVFTVHGDKDNYVPYEHSVRLHDALTKAGVPNQLMTIRGAGHNGAPFEKQFTREDMANIFHAIKEFLGKNSVIE